MNIIILGCNGNIGKFISVNLANNKNNKVYGIDLHSEFLGENENITYYQNDFLKNGLNKDLKNVITSSKDQVCFINFIAKDYPVSQYDSESFLSKNSPFELDLDEVCNSFKITLGSSYKLLQEIMKFENKYIHLILMGSIFSRNLPNPKNYSEEGNIYKPVAYSLSKSAQNILFKEACRSISGERLRINMLTMGGVQTDQNESFVKKYISQVPINKMVSLNDILDCLNWLIFKSPSMVNGCEFLLDGGWTLAN